MDGNTPPADRAHERLLVLTAHSDEAGNACTWDPWPFAQAERMLNSLDQPLIGEWQRLYSEFRQVDDGYSGPLLRRPDFQRMAASRCLELRAVIEAGDGGAVLEAVAQCAAHGLVMPAWLAVEYLRRHAAVIRGDAKDWNDAPAFGSAYPKGTNIAGVRANALEGPHAYEVATRLLEANPERPIDRALFEEVGERIGKGQTRVQELIRAHVAQSDGLVPPIKFLRDRLKSGWTLSQAFRQWQGLQLDALNRSLGYEIDAEGAWSLRNDPGN